MISEDYVLTTLKKAGSNGITTENIIKSVMNAHNITLDAAKNQLRPILKQHAKLSQKSGQKIKNFYWKNLPKR